MSINPPNYNLDELRRLAEDREMSTNGEGDVGLPGMDARGASLRDGLYRELVPLETGTRDVEKPYLPALPEAFVGEQVVFEWIEYLQATAGYQGAVEALDYYESIDWITSEVERDLQDYLLGLDDGIGAGDLDIDDHVLSLAYIAKLASMR